MHMIIGHSSNNDSLFLFQYKINMPCVRFK